MLKSRCRTLVIALAVGGLSMLGTGGASAAADGATAVPRSGHQTTAGGGAARPVATETGTPAGPPEGGQAPGPTHPFCEGGSPLLGSPLCPSKWPPS